MQKREFYNCDEKMNGQRGLEGCLAVSQTSLQILLMNIKNISKKCFAFSGLESIYFPKFIKKVNSMAFFKCDKLRKINFNEGIVELGESSFQNNISLKSIDIPNSLTIIKSKSFFDCSNLIEVNTTPNTNLIEIHNRAFDYTQIKELRINF